MAKRTYTLDDPVANNLLFMGHSFRVGTTVILHIIGGENGKDIQSWLHLKLDTFMMYLCGVPHIALKHVHTFNLLVDIERWV
jgi:hypothetical protein